MMNMYSKYDNMHKNGLNYALKCTNNHVVTIINFMLSVAPYRHAHPYRLSIHVLEELHNAY